MKMPEPDAKGVYRFERGPGLRPMLVKPAAAKGLWIASEGVDLLRDGWGQARYFPTPQDAARALGFTID